MIKKTMLSSALIVSSIVISAKTNPEKPATDKNQSISFTENKGQVYDQNFKPRPDVLYGAMTGNMAVHIKKTGVSYQLYRVDSYKEVTDEKTKQPRKEIDQQTIYRIDLNWLNCNTNFTKSVDETLEGYNNYYLASCPDGALNVRSYTGVTLQNLYKGIDLHYYEKNSELKHDYIVAAHADYKQIKVKVDGAEISVNKDGSLLLTTPLGKIQEGAPVVFQNGNRLDAKWLVSNNILSFDIKNYNSNYELIIDPITRIWGTYYGGIGNEYGYGSSISSNNNIYIVGYTTSSTTSLIATSGGHQNSFIGFYDGFISKFDANGIRLWASYYGGSGADIMTGCSADANNNINCSGYSSTSSSTVISTASSHQSQFGGGTYDAFLVQFNSNGTRQWATYYGGTNNDYGQSCCCDINGNIYLTGFSNSNNGSSIATSSSHQSSLGGGADAFLAKFNSSGVRQWGTYYGGSGGTADDYGYGATSDANGDVYVVGITGTSNGTVISTLNSHQSTFGGGGTDAFLVKFNTNGIRQWGTYYGGNGADKGFSCNSGASSVYIAGSTTSSTGIVIASLASHQGSYGTGNSDSYLAKFDLNGSRQWGTYYGGTGEDVAQSCLTDNNGNCYLAGFTSSTTGTIIATSSSHQSIYGGGSYDAFITKFTTSGVRQWGTYYGGSSEDQAYSCTIDTYNGLYVVGSTASSSGTTIATLNSHQPTNSGGLSDAFLVKFDACDFAPSTPIAITGSTSMCAGATANYSTQAFGATSYTWSLPTGWSGSSNSTSISATSGSSGVFSVIGSNACGISPQQTLSVTVNALPTLSISSSNNLLCVGESATLTVSGALNYTFNPGGTGVNVTVSPVANTTYSLVGIDANGCKNTAVITQSVSECLGLNESNASKSAIKIYPNPANDFVYFELEGDQLVTIINSVGEIVYSKYSYAGIREINLENLPTGIYLLKFSKSSKDYKLVKN